MKKTILGKVLVMTVAFLFIFITGSKGQDTVKASQGRALIKMKIVDDNGKERVIDTTFVITDRKGREAFEKAMQLYESSFGDLEGKMKEVEKLMELSDFEVILDSLHQDIIHLGEDMECPYFIWKDKDKDFDFDVNVPPVPRMPRVIREWGENDEDQTLSDLIGDISMDRIVSYSIKDRKGGKRIIIDLDDESVLDHKDMIIMRGKVAPRHSGMMVYPDRKMRVIVRPDDHRKKSEKKL